MAFRSIKAGLRNLFGRTDADADVRDELEQYLEEATQERMRAGISREEAERAARAQIGSLRGAREQALSANWETRFEAVLKDIRFGLRTIRRNPGFAAAAILTIALGTGANTAVFSVVNAVMLRPLPWQDAGKLALIWTDDARRGLHREATASLTISDWQAASRRFQDIAYFSTQRVAPMSNDPGGERGRSRSALVSGNMFTLLGVAPLHGRALAAEDEASRASVAVISHTFWQRWFGGSPDIIGKTLTIDDASKGGLGILTVVGVMPPGFYFPDRLTEIWTPATTYWRFNRESTERFPSWARRWTAIGRVAPDASIDDAREELAGIGQHLASTHVTNDQDFPGFATSVVPILDSITGQTVQSALWLLLGAVSLVLLVGCANVANLLLARGAARQEEFALRRALGAGRGHIVRQLLTESLLLSIVGGILGTVLAIWITGLLATSASGFVPRINEVAVDWRVLGFAMMASVVAGIAFGLGPAIQLSKSRTGELLHGGRTSGQLKLRRSRDLLIAAECALALVLLTGAGLLLRSLLHVYSVEPGFDPQNVLTVRLEFPTEPPPTAAERTQTSTLAQAKARARVALASGLVDRVRVMPGIASVGFSDDLFVAGQGNDTITIPGRAERMTAGELNSGTLTSGFFPALKVPLRRGRLITDDDLNRKIAALWSPVITDLPLAEKERRALPEPVVVNEAFVRRFFPDEEPIGRKFCIDPTNKTYWYEIVGVVGDMHRQGLERAAIPEFFGPWIPSPNGRVDLLVRTEGDPLVLSASLREEARRAIPGATVVSVNTADALLGGFSALRRLQTWLLTGFAVLGLALASIGIFGLVHFTVAERRREIGIRVALGAAPSSVMRLVLVQGMRSPAIGIAVGLAASLALTQMISSLLFGVGPADPVTFGSVAALLASISALACWVASRRALRIDPLNALKNA